jgi:hypothetical protein
MFPRFWRGCASVVLPCRACLPSAQQYGHRQCALCVRAQGYIANTIDAANSTVGNVQALDSVVQDIQALIESEVNVTGELADQA